MGKGRYVLPCLVLICIALLPAAASVRGKPQYMVLAPSSLHTETPEKSCLLLRRLNETVTVSAYLESTKGKRSLFNDLIADKDLFHCVSFTLPRSSSFEDELFFSVQIKGPTHEFSKRTKVLVKNTESLVFIQTDKQIYTPGQSVKFRIVSVDKNFHPLHELFPLVHIEDPGMNRIMQWQNIQLENGLKQLSFSLSSEPIKGSYKIVILKQSGIKTEHSFTVEEFVLPKFEVQVKVPKVITVLDEEVNVTVCGIYTYGKPVPGHVTMSICRKYHYSFYRFGRNLEVPCEEVSQKLDSHGCIMQQVKTSVFQLKEQNFQTMKLQVNAKITEEGTELELTGTGTIEVTRTLTKLTFVKVDSHFRRGIPFFGQVCLVDGKGVPIPDELISIQANEANYSSNATTDEHGLVQFSIDTTNVTDSSLTVSVYHKEQSPCFSYYYCMTEKHKQAYHTANHVFSLSKSYVYLEAVAGPLPCGQIHTIQAHYILNGQVLGELKELVFYYLIMAKGSIIRTGVHILPLEPGKLRGHFSMSVPVESDIAPIAQLLLYAILPDGEVFGDFAKYEVENCLPNKVDLSFHPTQSLPASHTHLRVTASPQSLCALRAVDQSVLLMKPEAELSPASVYNLLPAKDFADFIHSSNQQKEDQKDCIKRDNVSIDGLMYSSVSHSNEEDVYSFMRSMDLKVFTNLKIKHPKFCPDDIIHQPPVALPFVEYNEVIENFRVQPFTETVRNYFPETWIWDLVVVNSSGVAEVGATVPDTITEWKAGALCLSSGAGLGLSPTASLQAFQPFFLELTMPYSVIRGEAFTLKATVLNYLPKCIRVSVQLEASLDFMAIPVEKDQDSYCLCSNGRQTVSWLVTPKSLGNVNFSVSAETLQSSELCGNEVAVVPEIGRKDTVVKLLLVEPEGIKKEYAFNSLLCASDVGVSEKLSLKLPSKVVEESARASFSVLGDILGSAIKNTQNLLQMPYGCGEQNMVLFAPNIYVLKYLNETHQLTQEIKSKAIGYLNAGYQRQLNYKHRDGSYSAFGDQHGKKKGNTWLTAFVLKSLAQARAFIFIDETHITQALTWLSNKQKNDGCFKSSGSLLNNAIKGGVEDEVTLSTYITIALLEIPLPVTHPVVHNALLCLESAWKTTQEEAHGSHVYTKALLAYAFALAGDQDKRREILKSLEEEAIKEHNATHWERPQKPKASVEHLYEPQAPSAEVEMTSYVLLAYLTAQPTPTSEDLTSATHIVKWITKQQNSQGGFSSTQDTVVALHALSIYGAATFAGTGEAALVTIQSSGTFSTKFQVENTNRLLLQQVSLPDIPGEYSINVSGEGCVYIQAALKYNVFLEKKESAFALQVQTIPQICDGLKVHTSFQVSLEVSYTGSRPVSNMVIADVKMISGFIPLKPTVKMLELSSHVSRTEVSNNNVLIYVEQVTSQTLSFSFTVVQDIPVRDLKPAIVKVYDYYETDEAAFAEYSAPCHTDQQWGSEAALQPQERLKS
ncbi:alpha-2-macroglobulin isoform X1 [Equus caballus]|uniref:alpha-2-macroglobulin isoform X1 n=1 Tax=Equus caballus TaxID=9796 RepID=UPI0004BDD22F|nr:PREDICTED: alpha-2-macroglobulin-like isoform X1 [Equus przewalskii]XP_014596181.1 alpha-2-macroglobulin isoform X1 [Equus caballus]